MCQTTQTALAYLPFSLFHICKVQLCGAQSLYHALVLKKVSVAIEVHVDHNVVFGAGPLTQGQSRLGVLAAEAYSQQVAQLCQLPDCRLVKSNGQVRVGHQAKHVHCHEPVFPAQHAAASLSDSHAGVVCSRQQKQTGFCIWHQVITGTAQTEEGLSVMDSLQLCSAAPHLCFAKATMITARIAD